jgi:predicted transcriptional regulator
MSTIETSRIHDNNYIHITGWMVSKLNLKGNDLLVYAIIYGFSQDGNSRFTGSLQYLADWVNSSKQTVMTSLKKLVEQGFIEKFDKVINGVKFVEYYTKNLTGVYKKFDWGYTKNLTGGIQNSLPNNIKENKEYNKEDNNIKNLTKKDFENSEIENVELPSTIKNEYPPQFEEVWNLYKKHGNKKLSFKAFSKIKNLNLEQLKASIVAYYEFIEKHRQSGFDRQPRDFERFLSHNDYETDWVERGNAIKQPLSLVLYQTSESRLQQELNKEHTQQRLIHDRIERQRQECEEAARQDRANGGVGF